MFLGFGNRKEEKSNLISKREFDEIFGYQLCIDDFGSFYKGNIERGFFTSIQVDNMLAIVNQKGYLDERTGNYLNSIFNNNSDIYIKTVHSSDVDSIMKEGVRCLGSSTSGSGFSPRSVSQVKLENTITWIDGMFDLVHTLKNANGISQGLNPIDGTIVLSIPNGVGINEVLYFNESSGCYCIKPEYIDCFIGVNERGIVSEPKFNDNFYLNSMNENEGLSKPYHR